MSLIDRLGSNGYGLTGLTFAGEEKSKGRSTVVVMLPSEEFCCDDYMVIYPSAQVLGQILERLDEPMPQKAFIRKGQRTSLVRLKQDVWRRDNYRCVYCNREIGDVTMTVDHFVPYSYGGATEYENLVTCCLYCNRDKGDQSPETWCQANGIDYGAIVANLGLDKTGVLE